MVFPIFYLILHIMEIIILIIAAVAWLTYEYIRAPFYDEERKVFYKKKKK